MSQVQVRESKIGKVIEGIKMFFESLAVNEGIVNDSELEKQIKEIKKYENSEKISKLEAQTTSVDIPLKDSIVKKAIVSEKEAQRVANEVKAKSAKTKDSQKQIGE